MNRTSLRLPFLETRNDFDEVGARSFLGSAQTGAPSTKSQPASRETLSAITVRVGSAEKTLADCFKFRNKIGMDVVLEGLKLYRTKGAFDLGKLLKYARICRVERAMRPYLEAML